MKGGAGVWVGEGGGFSRTGGGGRGRRSLCGGQLCPSADAETQLSVQAVSRELPVQSGTR